MSQNFGTTEGSDPDLSIVGAEHSLLFIISYCNPRRKNGVVERQKFFHTVTSFFSYPLIQQPLGASGRKKKGTINYPRLSLTRRPDYTPLTIAYPSLHFLYTFGFFLSILLMPQSAVGLIHISLICWFWSMQFFFSPSLQVTFVCRKAIAPIEAFFHFI